MGFSNLDRPPVIDNPAADANFSSDVTERAAANASRLTDYHLTCQSRCHTDIHENPAGVRRHIWRHASGNLRYLRGRCAENRVCEAFHICFNLTGQRHRLFHGIAALLRGMPRGSSFRVLLSPATGSLSAPRPACIPSVLLSEAFQSTSPGLPLRSPWRRCRPFPHQVPRKWIVCGTGRPIFCIHRAYTIKAQAHSSYRWHRGHRENRPVPPEPPGQSSILRYLRKEPCPDARSRRSERHPTPLKLRQHIGMCRVNPLYMCRNSRLFEIFAQIFCHCSLVIPSIDTPEWSEALLKVPPLRPYAPPFSCYLISESASLRYSATIYCSIPTRRIPAVPSAVHSRL